MSRDRVAAANFLVIADSPKCTQKFLFCLAVGISPIHYAWVLSCAVSTIATCHTTMPPSDIVPPPLNPYLLGCGLSQETGQTVSFPHGISLRPLDVGQRVLGKLKISVIGPRSVEVGSRESGTVSWSRDELPLSSGYMDTVPKGCRSAGDRRRGRSRRLRLRPHQPPIGKRAADPSSQRPQHQTG